MGPLSNFSPALLRLQTSAILSITKQRHRQLRCHRARNNRNINTVQPAKCARKLRLVILINQQRGIKHRPLHDRLAACSLDAAELDYARCQRAGGGLGADATGVVDGFQRESAGGGAQEQRGRAVECPGGGGSSSDPRLPENRTKPW